MTPSPAPAAPTLSNHRQLAFDTLLQKSLRNLQDLPSHPTTWSFDADGEYTNWPEGFFEIGNWTTSFFTGMGLISWLATGNQAYLDALAALEPLYQAKVGEHAADTMHDLGFLYSLYSVGLHRITGAEHHRILGIQAAKTLAHRFVPAGNYIRAWGRMDESDTDYAGLAIIDCMMNVPLLCWATEQTGDPSFQKIAELHSDTTLRHFVRPDDSVYHAFRFDPVSGHPAGGDNYCGWQIESHWARGTAWAIYGFAMAFRCHGHQRYLDASLRLLRKFLSLLDPEIIPWWDFRLPEPDAPRIRDSSAAAIVACGIQELEALGAADSAATAAKHSILDRLCSPDYLETNPAIRGTLRHGQVARAKDVFTSWGDYYLMEALAREAGLPINWW